MLACFFIRRDFLLIYHFPDDYSTYNVRCSERLFLSSHPFAPSDISNFQKPQIIHSQKLPKNSHRSIFTVSTELLQCVQQALFCVISLNTDDICRTKGQNSQQNCSLMPGLASYFYFMQSTFYYRFQQNFAMNGAI